MSPVGREWRREPLYHLDPELNELLRGELIRQQETLELIASENFASRAVLEATGSVLTNKYAEGLPGARYYGGCEIVDQVEQLAIDRCKAVFGCEHVNVQPHSGSSANLAALFALLDPGDTLMAHGAGPRRPSHARARGQLLRAHLRRGPLPRAPRHRDHRLRRGQRAGAGAPPQAHHLRLQFVPPDRRLGRVPRDRRRVRRPAARRHRPHRRPHRRRGPPQPGALLRRRHEHHAQDPHRTARRPHHVSPGVRKGDRPGRLPGHAGRAAHARHRRQGGLPQDRPERAVPPPAATDRRQLRRPCRHASPTVACASCRGARTSTWRCSTCAAPG